MRYIAFTLLVALSLAVPPAYAQSPNQPPNIEDFSENGLIIASAKYLGATAESMAEIIDSVFSRYGPPSAIIQGEDASVAAVFGVRYGRGIVKFQDGREASIYWRGPSIGPDAGATGSKSFALVYNADTPEDLHKRFAGVGGSAFYIGGAAVNYLQRGDVIIAPIRAGVGFRLGANIGYMNFTPTSGWMPF